MLIEDQATGILLIFNPNGKIIFLTGLEDSNILEKHIDIQNFEKKYTSFQKKEACRGFSLQRLIDENNTSTGSFWNIYTRSSKQRLCFMGEDSLSDPHSSARI